MSSTNVGATTNLTVLTDLPKFSGNPRSDEAPFKSDLDARTFLRALDSYFECHHIDNDQKKMHILFSQIDKKKGNAVNFVTSYVNKKVPFKEVKEVFLMMYPQTSKDLRQGAQKLLETKIDEQDMFCGMTQLEATALSVAEAYLGNTGITKGKFDADTVIKPKTRPPVPATQETSPDAEDGSNAADERTDTVADTRAPPSASEEEADITLLDLLQNALMHMVIASQVHHRVYEKVAKSGPQTRSNKLMAQVVTAAAKHQQLLKDKQPRTQEDFIYRAAAEQRPRFQGTSPQEKTWKNTLKCYNCGKEGHTRKRCPVCSYCKETGHSAKSCQKRITQAKGKFCSYCKLRDSHSLSECRKRKRTTQGPGGDIRVLQPRGKEDEDAMIMDPYYYEDTSESDDAGN